MISIEIKMKRCEVKIEKVDIAVSHYKLKHDDGYTFMEVGDLNCKSEDISTDSAESFIFDVDNSELSDGGNTEQVSWNHDPDEASQVNTEMPEFKNVTQKTKKKANTRRKENTSPEQVDIYLKLLEEDKIFRIGIPPKNNPGYIGEKWGELTNQLNNCKVGPKCLSYEWQQRFRDWRRNLSSRSRKLENGIQTNIRALNPTEKKACYLWRDNHDEQLEKNAALESNRQKVHRDTRIRKTTCEQYDIYLKLLEEDKIFRVGKPPQENPQYIDQKWTELSHRLNNCKSGGKLSPKLWKERFDKSWKCHVKRKWRNVANDKKSGILVLTEQEKKAIDLWQIPALESNNTKDNIRIQKTSPEQYDIYLKLLEEDEIFRNRIPPTENPQYIAEKWAELSKRLNNCKTGGTLSVTKWKERLDILWKSRLKTKCQQMENCKRRSGMVLTKQEKKAIDLLQINFRTQRPYLRKSMIWNFFEKTNKTTIYVCTICKTNVYFYGNTNNFNYHLRSKHPGLINDGNAASPSIDTAATNTPKMSPITQASMHDTVHQITQSQTPYPCTMRVPSEPLTAIQAPPSTTDADEALVILHTVSPQDTSAAIRQLGPPTSSKRTELSEPEKQKIDQSLIKLLLSNFQPISILENKGFLEYSYNLQPLYTVPTRKLLSNHMLTKYQETKQKLLGILQKVSYVAVTIDMWTSVTNRTFLALTSNFIFDKKLKSAFLSVKEIPERHNADSLANAIFSTLEEWAISTKVVTIVTDNVANIKKAIENLKMYHHPCVANTFNQCVTDAIKEAPELSALLKTCRSLVAHFKHNTVASESLKQMQKQMGLPELKVKQDIDTIWNSSLIMLNRLLELKQPLSSVRTSFSNGPRFLNASEWDIIRDCTSILRPLELMIKELSTEKYITLSSIIPLIRGLQSTITKEITITSSGCHFKTALLDLLRERLEILEIDKSCAKATFLDARFKNVVFSIEANADNVKKAIMDEISVNISKRNCTTCTEISEERRTNTSLWSFMREIAPNGAAIANAPSVTVNLSVEQYLNMELIDISQDPLEFWNRNEKLLPELFQISQKYLCIPASSIASERTFSKLNEIINEKRNRLDGEKLNQIVFLDSNLEF